VVVQDQNGVVGASAIATIAPNDIDAAGTLIQDVQLAGSDIVVATFSDADLDDTAASFAATINLGNGLPPVIGTVQGADGQFTVSLPNPTLAGSSTPYPLAGYFPGVGNATDGIGTFWYFDDDTADDGEQALIWAFFGGLSAGGRVVTVTLQDAGMVVANVNSTVVLGAPVQVPGGSDYITAAPLISPPTPATYTSVANVSYTVTSWGDGSAVGSGPHTYAEPGNYTISYSDYQYVYIASGGSYHRTVTGTLSIAVPATDTPITPLPVGQVNGTAGESLAPDIPLYSFSSFDPDATASDFTATIDWGDGQSSAGTVTLTEQGTFIVSGDHTYDSGGTFPITRASAHL